MVTIALDAMGGDQFPKPEIEGALEAAAAFGVSPVSRAGRYREPSVTRGGLTS